MAVSLEAIRALREETSAPIGDCRAALEEAKGDLAKARQLLKQRGEQSAKKREGRATDQGRVGSYVHHDGRLAALVEVDCETDFVARSSEFQQFCRDVAMHVAASGPRYMKAEEAPALNPEERKAACLLEQPFVKDPGTSIQQLLTALIAKTGENVVIRRFSRLAVGE